MNTIPSKIRYNISQRRVLVHFIALMSLELWARILNPSLCAQTSEPPITAKAELNNAPKTPTIRYAVPGVISKLKQPDSMACWATAATILLQWKWSSELGENHKLAIDDTVEIADKNALPGVSFKSLLEDRQGLSDIDKPRFLKSLGLVAEIPANYTVQGWLELIQKFGLLWVTTELNADKGGAIHAQIITGLTGDGTYGGTIINFLDPMDGQEHRESLLDFVRRYEAVAIDDIRKVADDQLRLQVIHFSATKR